jgi:hypothetical protein
LPNNALQLIGDGLLVALRQEVQEASGLAGECVAALRVRGWQGDDDLADSLEARLGMAPIRLLRPLAVDLEELAIVLEGDPLYSGGRIDLLTGEVWPNAAIEDSEEMAENDWDDDGDPDRWLWVHSEGSRSGYRDMEWFISEIDDTEVADRLRIAISGRGAFRRFKDTLSRWPEPNGALVRLLGGSPARPRASLARRRRLRAHPSRLSRFLPVAGSRARCPPLSVR